MAGRVTLIALVSAFSEDYLQYSSFVVKEIDAACGLFGELL